MSDLIDREDVLNLILNWKAKEPWDKFDQQVAFEIIHAMPSAQPEIIRCKDCKYNASSHKCIHPDSFFLIPKDDDFCSYAERREE